VELEHVGEFVKEERIRRGLSQRDLAERSDGLAQDTISGIERGEHTPRPSTLRRLAKGLGVEVGDLFPKREAPVASGR
jgi:transcriptional regulator with XRE-family HTH domain